jgi:hypothetical protein
MCPISIGHILTVVWWEKCSFVFRVIKWSNLSAVSAVAEHLTLGYFEFLVAEKLYKHCCLSVCPSICLSVPIFLKVNVTSTEARLLTGSCAMEWNKVLPTPGKWRPMPTPILLTQLCNSCSRIVLISPGRTLYSLLSSGGGVCRLVYVLRFKNSQRNLTQSAS